MISDGVSTYVYDETNRMVLGTNAQNETSEYIYNGLGHLVGKEDRDYVLDYVSPLANAIMEGATRYVYGLGKLSVTADNETLWYHRDRLGSTDYLTDTYGVVAAYVTYDDWGVPMGGDVFVAEYTGHMYDVVLGVYYARARMYSANDRRFVAVDILAGLIVDPQSLNRYVYCADNPLKFVDLNGLWKSDVHKTDTKQWAKDTGFTEAEAKIIANANNGVDFSISTLPYIGDTSWHVNTNGKNELDSRQVHANECLDEAIKIWNNATADYEKAIKALKLDDPLYAIRWWSIQMSYTNAKNQALETLGRGLHALQDIYAHGNISTHMPWEHHDNIAYDWTDDTKTQVKKSGSTEGQRYKDTEAATKNYFKAFFCGIGR